VPLIILVDYGFSVYEANHFMVVTGYTKNGVLVNSGRKENQEILEGELARIWKKTDYWTLVVTPLP
jgi:ABC-type bacteriocin/lantibiotic exporter with double-glycine peptidase domain